MNREDIVKMAREAGLYSGEPRTPSTGRMIEKRLERFADLVAAAEREACAKICEAQRNMIVKSHPARIEFDPNDLMAQKCADAIRARGTK